MMYILHGKTCYNSLLIHNCAVTSFITVPHFIGPGTTSLCTQPFPDVAALTPQASIVYICASVNKHAQQHQPGLADGSREPLISSAGLLVTRLVNAPTKMVPARDPVPKTTTPRPRIIFFSSKDQRRREDRPDRWIPPPTRTTHKRRSCTATVGVSRCCSNGRRV